MAGVGLVAGAGLGAAGSDSGVALGSGNLTAAPSPAPLAQSTLTPIELPSINTAFACNLGDVKNNLAQPAPLTNYNTFLKKLWKEISCDKAKQVDRYNRTDMRLEVVGNFISLASDYCKQYHKENSKQVAAYNTVRYMAQAANQPPPPTVPSHQPRPLPCS
ncbi:hypothetical protein BJ085DRAFT_28189 [Dimargaris cristalligena]|uniref:Uncharacterized protein n=1 Tax=Dimargaris cristalligena TaxID=215637 RepID=A0A4P9ZJI5_9FUNG|nr:hypothetical protein BJ085DRAFT_28189 [Dimargaris cristalligena]|eukprot:RKP33198.1 hypothetical protein BJ085DRAFT_28189 [Dimargaris cristalligena]